MANFIFHLGSFIRRIYLSSRRVLFQTIYVILVIITLLLCGYNVFQSFVEYALHPQVVTLEKQPPFQTDFPGLTICAPSIFTPKRLGGLLIYSFFCSINKWSEFFFVSRDYLQFQKNPWWFFKKISESKWRLSKRRILKTSGNVQKLWIEGFSEIHPETIDFQRECTAWRVGDILQISSDQHSV